MRIPMASLTPQEKLALALTSAGSQRNLAKLLGVTHQKVGRWLREGEPGGIQAIPRDAIPAINVAFAFHSEVTKQQAKVDGVPFDRNFPVFVNRPILAATDRYPARPGDRVFVENTQFIRRDLSEKVLKTFQQSGQVMQASIRSTVNLKSYLKVPPNAPNQSRALLNVQPTSSATQASLDSLQANFEHRNQIDPNTSFLQPIYTLKENFAPGRTNAGRNIWTEKLRPKHQPATGEKGTVFADQYLFQLNYQPRQTPGRANVKKTKQSRVNLKRK